MLNRKGYSQLLKGLQNLDLEVLPSFANFLCVNLKSPSLPISQLLLSQGVSVRPLHDYGLSSFLRVSIGTYTQNKYFLSILQKILVKSSTE